MAQTSDDSIITSTSSSLYSKTGSENRRGFNVYSISDLLGLTAIDKRGQFINGTYQVPYYLLTIDQRNDIFRSSSEVFGIVTSRMNRVASLEWDIVSDKKQEDKIVQELKRNKQVFVEFENQEELKFQIAKFTAFRNIQEYLTDILPDLSNFETALLRWYRDIQWSKQDRADDIKDWLYEPNPQMDFDDFLKAWIYDIMIHGAASIFKESENGRLENFYLLPGGTVFPFRDKYVSPVEMYFQVILTEIDKVYFSDELSYSSYLPTSSRSYPYIPLEAAVNKISEILLFDRLMAEQADGTKPPQKIVLMGTDNPFGNSTMEFELPLPEEEQKRIENMMTEASSQAVKVLSGYGKNLSVLDLTRENTMGIQLERQKMLREVLALVFNVSNLEANLSGNDSNSGRATSESLETIDQNRSVIPLVNIIKNKINKDLLPYRAGSGYKIDFKVKTDENAELDIDIKQIQNGIKTTNEIRIKNGDDPYNDKKYDLPLENNSQQLNNDLLGNLGN